MQPIKLQEKKKKLLQLFTNQLSTGSIKYFHKLKNPAAEPLNFAIAKSIGCD